MNDIKGATPGTANRGAFHERERVLIKEFGKLDDIHGSQPGSKVTGIKRPEGCKMRETNPLAPSYQIPGATEVAEDDPFG